MTVRTVLRRRWRRRNRAGHGLVALSGLLALAPVASGQPAPYPARPVAATPLPAIFRIDPAFDQVVSPAATVETLVTIPGVNSEGPIWHGRELWFGDIVSGTVFAVGMDRTIRVIAREAGGKINPALKTRQGAVGMANWRNGAILVCGGALRDIGLLDRDSHRTSFLSTYAGKHLNSPNDLVVARDGALWFSDPAYSVPGYSPLPGSPVPAAKEMPFNGVFRYRYGKLQAMITDMEVPNGLGFSVDGRIFYVSNSAPDMFVRAYRVGPDGALSNPRIFARFSEADRKGPGVPDGLKVDSSDHVWLAAPGGVHVFTRDGRLLGRIQLPVKPTNLVFGEDMQSLFITAGDTVYRVRTLVKGQVPPYAPVVR